MAPGNLNFAASLWAVAAAWGSLQGKLWGNCSRAKIPILRASKECGWPQIRGFGGDKKSCLSGFVTQMNIQLGPPYQQVERICINPASRQRRSYFSHFFACNVSQHLRAQRVQASGLEECRSRWSCCLTGLSSASLRINNWEGMIWQQGCWPAASLTGTFQSWEWADAGMVEIGL